MPCAQVTFHFHLLIESCLSHPWGVQLDAASARTTTHTQMTIPSYETSAICCTTDATGVKFSHHLSAVYLRLLHPRVPSATMSSFRISQISPQVTALLMPAAP